MDPLKEIQDLKAGLESIRFFNGLSDCKDKIDDMILMCWASANLLESFLKDQSPASLERLRRLQQTK